MIKEFSTKITNWLIKNNTISIDDKTIYEYSIEALSVLFISYVSLIIIALFVKEIMNSLLFFITFSLFRRINGGYHSKSYKGCAILSLITYAFFLIVIKNHRYINNRYVPILILSLLVIFIFSPQDTCNKPLSKKQKYYFSIISKLITTAFFIIITLLYYFDYDFHNKHIMSISYGIITSANSLLLILIERGIKKGCEK